MRDAKKRELTAQGWKIGGTAEFLGLSAGEKAYIELRLRLAEGLRQQRLGQKMTQAALAKAVQSSQSRVAKMESGDATVSLDLLIRSLIALGASRQELARIITGTGRHRAA
jgi:DNA-binding XRE family transcriptional regulator